MRKKKRKYYRTNELPGIERHIMRVASEILILLDREIRRLGELTANEKKQIVYGSMRLVKEQLEHFI